MMWNLRLFLKQNLTQFHPHATWNIINIYPRSVSIKFEAAQNICISHSHIAREFHHQFVNESLFSHTQSIRKTDGWKIAFFISNWLKVQRVHLIFRSLFYCHVKLAGKLSINFFNSFICLSANKQQRGDANLMKMWLSVGADKAFVVGSGPFFIVSM